MSIRPAFLLSIAALLLQGSATAEPDPWSSGLQHFKQAMRDASASGFEKAATSFHQATARDPKSVNAWHWLATARFHEALARQYTATDEAQPADPSIRSAIEALETTLELAPADAEAHAMLATLIGMRIEASPLRGITLGPQVEHHRKLASKHGANNPRAQYLVGTILLHTANDDKSRREALKILQEAEKIYQKESKQPLAPNEIRWGHDACLAFIGKAYAELRDTENARHHYRQALAIHPNNPLAKAGLATLDHPSSPSSNAPASR